MAGYGGAFKDCGSDSKCMLCNFGDEIDTYQLKVKEFGNLCCRVPYSTLLDYVENGGGEYVEKFTTDEWEGIQLENHSR